VLRISFTAISDQRPGLRAAIEQEFRQMASRQGWPLQTQGVGGQAIDQIWKRNNTHPKHAHRDAHT
jgi:hypothetical protein